MSFAEIERVIGAGLPPAADRYPAWWSNNPSNNVMTKVWLEAGFRTERVDLNARRLVFRRVASGARQSHDQTSRPGAGGVLARLRQSLGGTVRIVEGVDLAAPTGEPWDAERQ